VACALKALWHIDAASVVIIHDYAPRASDYSPVLAFYDIVDKVHSMVVLARKAELNWEAAEAALLQYVNEPQR